ncbi:MAG TPA: LLM class flavin-dependent oxidoreductase [Candidatus Limnocylindria bacterium]|nr:LLM class flavin-dependent oxidoreductase [Candidatus Limnocylindria bacterium]
MVSIGVQTWGTDVAALGRYWTRADALGYARITYGDGLWPWTHDGWTMLGALAAGTRAARIGPAVTYAFDPAAHHPSWLAKRAVTVDHLSGGRLDVRLAVGAEDAATAAWWASHGIGYPRAGARIAVLEETVALVRRLWTGEAVDHDGPGYRLAGARLAPGPVQRPGPPVWIAAMGERATDLVARCADGWEASFLGPPAFAAAWQRVRGQLARHGRGADSLRRSIELDAAIAPSRAGAAVAVRGFCAARGLGVDHPLVAASLIGDAETIAERIAMYAGAGATDLMLGFADFPDIAMLETFAERVGLGALTSPP